MVRRERGRDGVPAWGCSGLDVFPYSVYCYTMTSAPASTPTPEMFDLQTIKVSEAEWEANGQKPGNWRCLICNRHVNEDSPSTWWIWMAGDSNLFPLTTDEATAEQYAYGDMGMQPIGSACARKVPAAYKERHKS